MIIYDFSQILIIPAMSIGKHEKLNVDLLRHVALTTFKNVNRKFKKEYGPEIVVACDGRNYWRKEYFPYYKSARKTAREASKLDWQTVFDAMNAIKEEIEEYMPYNLINVEGAEADDIIATLVKHKSDNDKILIVSSDKDFVQLHNKNVKQWDTYRKRWIKHQNPQEYLIEHIVRGDAGDGIPNILSDGDAIANPEKRQKRLTKKKLEEALAFPQQFENYMRNKTLIDLSMIPEHIEHRILENYKQNAVADRSKIMKYFIKYRLKNLMSDIGDF